MLREISKARLKSYCKKYSIASNLVLRKIRYAIINNNINFSELFSDDYALADRITKKPIRQSKNENDQFNILTKHVNDKTVVPVARGEIRYNHLNQTFISRNEYKKITNELEKKRMHDLDGWVLDCPATLKYIHGSGGAQKNNFLRGDDFVKTLSSDSNIFYVFFVLDHSHDDKVNGTLADKYQIEYKKEDRNCICISSLDLNKCLNKKMTPFQIYNRKLNPNYNIKF